MDYIRSFIAYCYYPLSSGHNSCATDSCYMEFPKNSMEHKKQIMKQFLIATMYLTSNILSIVLMKNILAYFCNSYLHSCKTILVSTSHNANYIISYTLSHCSKINTNNDVIGVKYYALLNQCIQQLFTRGFSHLFQLFTRRFRESLQTEQTGLLVNS